MAPRSDTEVRRSTEDALVRVGRLISAGHDAIAAREGTTPLGVELLLLIREPRPQGVIAEALGLTEPRLSVLATRLVDKKLVRRRTGKDDKRFRILELTASGKAAAKRIDKARNALAPLAALSPAQAKQLEKLLALVEG